MKKFHKIFYGGLLWCIGFCSVTLFSAKKELKSGKKRGSIAVQAQSNAPTNPIKKRRLGVQRFVLFKNTIICALCREKVKSISCKHICNSDNNNHKFDNDPDNNNNGSNNMNKVTMSNSFPGLDRNV